MWPTIHPLLESRFGLDGGAMFGIIPKPLWERSNPADDANRIRMAARCLLVRWPDRNVLIDVGMGAKWTDREREMYAIHDQDPGLARALAEHGLTADDITDVVVSHLHFDHVGGLCWRDPTGQLVPTFARATHWVQRENWVWAHHPTPRDAGSYRAENFRLLGTCDGPRIELVDGDCTLWPGLSVSVCHGHTPGMQLVHVTTGTERVVFVADLFPTAGHLSPVWVMGYDLHPLVAMREKQTFLDQAIAGSWVLAFQHDPDNAFARIVQDGQRYRVQQAAAQLEALRLTPPGG